MYSSLFFYCIFLFNATILSMLVQVFQLLKQVQHRFGVKRLHNAYNVIANECEAISNSM